MKVIDAHAHVIPPALVDAMRDGLAPDGIRLEQQGNQTWVVHQQGYRYPLLDDFHDVATRLETMDRHGIDAAVLSVAPPLFLYWIDPAAGAEAARLVNDAVARMVEKAPDRFVGLATLPLQNPAASVAELRPRRPVTTSSVHRPTTLSWWSRRYAAIRPWLLSTSMGTQSYAVGCPLGMYRPTVQPGNGSNPG